MQFQKIALSGGPCAGRKTISIILKEELERVGYKVIILDSRIQDWQKNGIEPEMTFGFNKQLSDQMKMQISKEDLLGEEILDSGADKAVLICLNGLPEIRTIAPPSQYYAMLRFHNLTDEQLLTRYDAVFHLCTPARTSYSLYNSLKSHPSAPFKAVEKDDFLIKIWSEHQHFFAIPSDEDFNFKVNQLLMTVFNYLEENSPFIFSDTYLIETPDITGIPNMTVRKTDTYTINAGESISKIQTGNSDYYRYVVNKRIRYVDKGFFSQMLQTGDTSLRKVTTESFGYIDGSYYYTFVFYQHITDKAMIVVERRSEDDPIVLPESVKVIKKL